MTKFYVHITAGPWWREPHWGFTYDKTKAYVYDCSRATDRRHIEWGLHQFPGRLRLQAVPEARPRPSTRIPDESFGNGY